MSDVNTSQRASPEFIETLARDSEFPVDEVARIYEREFEALEASARVTSYLQIFVVRKVREILRHRATDSR